MSDQPVLIIGGGVIGLSIGWTLAREEVPVTLFERGRPGRKASWASAGMLAPDAELQFEEPELYRLNRESLRRWPDAYLVPKADDRLLVGATSEEMGFAEEVTGGALYDLLEGGIELVPGIRELPVQDVDVGFRPATRDNRPLLGPSGAPGIVYATGHYRHGILLTPITAQETARYVREGDRSDWIEPFLPSRFEDTRFEQQSLPK